MGHRWRRLRRLGSARLVNFVLLPTVVVLAVGVAAGPTLWHTLYPPVREFCVAQLAHLSSSHIIWYVLLLLAFLSFGALVLVLTRELVLSARLRDMIARRRTATPENLGQLQQRHQIHIPVVCTGEEGLYAFCYGLVRPAIVVSSGLNEALSEAEMEAVLLHEATHASSRDPLKILMSRLAASALFYIPLLHALEKRYVVRLEVAADRRAVSALGAQPLAAALSKILQAPAIARPFGVAASAVNASEERILHLLDPHRKLPSLMFPRVEAIATGFLIIGAGLLGGGLVSTVNNLIGSGAFCNFQM